MDDFDWAPLGRDWWLDAAKSAGASERQLKFAVGKFQGKSNVEAAIRAGYGGDDREAAKQHGYRLFRTRTVQTLLALAAAECRGGVDGTLAPQEARAILSQLARGSDPSVKIRAVEALARIDAAERDRAAALDDDGLAEWRVARDVLLTPAHCRAEMVAGFCLSLAPLAIAYWPMLHDLVPALRRDFPPVWDHLLARQAPAMRAELDRRLADTGWQLELRRRIWSEVNFEIGEDNVPRQLPKVRHGRSRAGNPDGSRAEQGVA